MRSVRRRGSGLVVLLFGLVSAVALVLHSGHRASSHIDPLPLTQVPPAQDALPAGTEPRFTLRNPIAASNQLSVPWGARSNWLQPWRGYLNTVSAVKLLNAIGVNFNVTGPAVVPLARLVRRAGFTRARIEVGWSQLEYASVPRFSAPALASLTSLSQSFRRFGIRPLILLNANDQAPVPELNVPLALQQPAAVGATSISLVPSGLARIVPGRTGIKEAKSTQAVTNLITSVAPDGTATLSTPLRFSIPAGAVVAHTLLYAPFEAPLLASGRPNPAFETTMSGWLSYVGLVTSTVKRILGSSHFDVEIWNELSFGSSFVEPSVYYPGRSAKAARAADSAVGREVRDRTVAYLRDPRNGVAGIGIGNGFANTVPWGSGANSPPGLTAIDKHPYHGMLSFPADSRLVGTGNRSVGAIGITDSTRVKDSTCNCLKWKESFTPRYNAFLPEYYLTGIQTETLIRDLSPFTTYIQRNPHGRFTHRPGAAAPGMWITEVNLDSVSPAKKIGLTLTTAQVGRIEAKAALRYLTAYVNKGVSALYFYALFAGAQSVVNPSLTVALKSEFKVAKPKALSLPATAVKAGPPPTSVGSLNPSLESAGPAALAISRLVHSMRGAQELAHPRQLRLKSIGDFQDAVQFHGNGKANTPALYNRDVLGFFPFQVNPSRFVIPVYVMTRDMLQVQQSDLASGAVDRFDLSPERYRLTIDNLPGCRLDLSVTDPLDGSAVPVRQVSCHRGRLQVDMAVTDYPRLLAINARRHS